MSIFAPSRAIVRLSLAVAWFFACGLTLAAEPKDAQPGATSVPASNRTPEQAAQLALEFLVQDMHAWRSSKGCATCHHGTMTIWALGEAQRRGYPVNAETLAEATAWTKQRFVAKLAKPRDARPGFDLVSVPGIYLGAMSHELPVLSRREVNDLAIHLAGHQETDGGWKMPPAANGAPPTWESRETIALLALLAWEPHVPADPKAAEAARTAREKALAWLAAEKPSETTQATALRLVLDARTGKPAEQLAPRIEELLRRQNADGGWSQANDLPSDAYATGQTLWALGCGGVDAARPEIRRAVEFLASTQQENGSWPMKSRNHAEDESQRQRNPAPITYFGACWGTLGLVRFVEPNLSPAARQAKVVDLVKTYSGSHTVDENDPAKPIVGVKIVYAVNDEELAELAKELARLPELAALDLKATGLSDAGIASLARLATLRSLSLENASITDAALEPLKSLSYLEALNLKGTKVTDAGVKSLQQTLPNVKIVR